MGDGPVEGEGNGGEEEGEGSRVAADGREENESRRWLDRRAGREDVEEEHRDGGQVVRWG